MGLTLAAIFWLAFPTPVFSQDPAEIAEQRSNLELWRKEIERAASMSPAEAIPLLGRCVVKMTKSSIFQVEERWDVYREAQAALLSRPGHAEFYAEKIKDAQREVERQRGTHNEGPAKSKLLNEQMYGFETLGQMPSPETVRVLGELLFDPWGLKLDAKPGEDPNNDKYGETSHASRALRALASLPLETRANATPAEKTTYWADIDSWKLWYSQVKAGTRTFRFEGDPQDYNLQGPVVKAVEPTLANRLRQDGAAETSGPAASDEEVSRLRVVALVAACGILGVAFWLSVIRRRPAGVKGQSP